MSVLTPILPQPGVNREGTRYSAEGYYYDSQLIRWRKGLPEEMGGWVRERGHYQGIARKLHDWSTTDSERYIGVGTTQKLYIYRGGTYYNLTPLVSESTLGADPFQVVTEGLIDITIPTHRAIVGMSVVISGAVSMPNIPDTFLNGTHQIVRIVDADHVSILAPTVVAPGAAGGGNAVVAGIEVPPGLDYYLPDTGWGAGPWGGGAWGGSAQLDITSQLRLWSMDNYGDDLITNIRNGPVYYWDESSGLTARPVPLEDVVFDTRFLIPDPLWFDGTTTVVVTLQDHQLAVGDRVQLSGITPDSTNPVPSLHDVPLDELQALVEVTAVTRNSFSFQTATASNPPGNNPVADGGAQVQAELRGGSGWCPTVAQQVMTSPVARHVVAFGCNEPGESVPDLLRVAWSSSERPALWYPTTENSAGSLTISTGSRFIGAIRTRQEILIWTDAGMHSMRYVGQPFVFTINEVETGVSMIGPNAAVNAGGVTFFMDRGGFFAYEGGVRRIPCSVRDYVFSDLDQGQAYKVHAGANVDFSEVMWFYVSKDSPNSEVDSYVKFNYDEGAWDYGRLARGAWIDAPTWPTPRASSIRKAGFQDVTLALTQGSNVMTVTLQDHRLEQGDVVRFQNLSGFGGVDPVYLNGAHAVAQVLDDQSFTVELTTNATSTIQRRSTGDATIELPELIFAHEVGYDADGEAMGSWVEIADMDLDEGHQFWFVNRFIPDIQFRGEFRDDTHLAVQIWGHNFPGEDRGKFVDVLVTPITEQTHVRLRARQISLRLEGRDIGSGWRMGKFRFGVRPDGRR